MARGVIQEIQRGGGWVVSIVYRRKLLTRNTWIVCAFALFHGGCSEEASDEAHGDVTSGTSQVSSSSMSATTATLSSASSSSGGTAGSGGSGPGLTASGGGAGAGGADDNSAVTTAGAGGEMQFEGGGLPGCSPSPCDAYLNESGCEDPSNTHIGCVWAEVRIVPAGDETCSEGFTEQRCLEMLAGGPGSCVVSAAECNEGAPLFVETTRGIALIQHAGCGIHPACFEYCGYADPANETGQKPAECACSCGLEVAGL